MRLGQFLLSLKVKDIMESIRFYEQLGFEVVDGGHTNNGFPDNNITKWRILRNENLEIGLFQGLFDNNILKFNSNDISKLRDEFNKSGIKIIDAKEDSFSNQLSSLTLVDPDGNTIRVDRSKL
ncbi:VOC family protein [Marinigracilibium pacificum]|uniref:VOC family protein n=1 Tax=Marinigracilibium pacificum TaxID=2729599 RepID=A0A848IY28_9BACT|nr:VOC family protein [Marinigracilibium pacificum]NMM48231.1 VOC family protein [Marinigracilibium pacificum]